MMTPDTHGVNRRGWVGVDLDGTLAEYNGWVGPHHIGNPIGRMVDRVVQWIKEGREVRVVTARVSPIKADSQECRETIRAWLRVNVYPKCPVWFNEPQQMELVITHEKDHCMVELWDDRCVQVIPNTGERADGKE